MLQCVGSTCLFLKFRTLERLEGMQWRLNGRYRLAYERCKENQNQCSPLRFISRIFKPKISLDFACFSMHAVQPAPFGLNIIYFSILN